MIKKQKVTMYSLSCDNCGRQFEGPDYDLYEDEDELFDDVQDAGWVGLYKGEYEPADDPYDACLSDADQHFCSLECREEWLEKKGGSND